MHIYIMGKVENKLPEPAGNKAKAGNVVEQKLVDEKYARLAYLEKIATEKYLADVNRAFIISTLDEDQQNEYWKLLEEVS